MKPNEGNISMRRPCIFFSGTGFILSMAGSRWRCRRILALPLFLLALAHPGPAQHTARQPSPLLALATELPNAPTPQLPVAPGIATASVAGAVTDSDGDSIAGARIILTPNGQPSANRSTPRVAITANDGFFNFPDLPSGPFKLSIAADGFAPQQISGELQPGETRQLPTIVLRSGLTISIQVTASQTEIAAAQVGEEERQHVLAIFPNFYVSYIPNPVPLDPRQKFQLAFRTLIDPFSFILTGAAAGIEQADNTYAWGQGARSYAKRYAAGYGTFLDGTLLTNAVLPVLFRQDPRYFYKGTGSVRSRVLYAIANSVVCKGDNHRWQPNYSGILGTLAASGISNLYYPAVNRDGASLTFENTAIGTGFTAAANLAQEFLVRRLTPHLPARVPAGPAPQVVR